MNTDYAPIGVAAAEKPSNKKTVMAVAGVLMVAGVIGMTAFSTGFTQVKSVTNAMEVTAELTAAFKDVCELTAEKRFVISVLDTESNSLIPCMEQDASDQWEGDFLAFQEGLKECLAVSSVPVAFGVYNMPVWTSEADGTYEILSTSYSFVAPIVDLAEVYTAGTFVGAAKLAAKCAPYSVTIESQDTYLTACEKINKPGIVGMCEQIEQTQCPFADGANPCQTCEHSTDGMAFGAIKEAFSAECCASIQSWCAEGGPGCGGYAYKRIYEAHCIEAYVEDAKPLTTYLHPALVPVPVPVEEPVVEVVEEPVVE
jgi:hypothetical protein